MLTSHDMLASLRLSWPYVSTFLVSKNKSVTQPAFGSLQKSCSCTVRHSKYLSWKGSLKGSAGIFCQQDQWAFSWDQIKEFFINWEKKQSSGSMELFLRFYIVGVENAYTSIMQGKGCLNVLCGMLWVKLHLISWVNQQNLQIFRLW